MHPCSTGQTSNGQNLSVHVGSKSEDARASVPFVPKSTHVQPPFIF